MDVAGGSIRAAISRWELAVWRQYQHVLDKWTPLVGWRWVGLLVVVLIYALHVFLVEGFYLMSYGLGIYILNLLIGFLSPQVDPEILDGEGPTLPSSVNDEFRPFVHRLPEFNYHRTQIPLHNKACTFPCALTVWLGVETGAAAALPRLGEGVVTGDHMQKF
ncbi:hypothetical protein VNO80_08897 [Phaseolus coccineus]|uniref:Uncharacterized protein n=1 Tax=Phaseolus coccineus TaxID=3886 RepID=A0AAN9NAK7_PHACN